LEGQELGIRIGRVRRRRDLRNLPVWGSETGGEVFLKLSRVRKRVHRS